MRKNASIKSIFLYVVRIFCFVFYTFNFQSINSVLQIYRNELDENITNSKVVLQSYDVIMPVLVESNKTIETNQLTKVVVELARLKNWCSKMDPRSNHLRD